MYVYDKASCLNSWSCPAVRITNIEKIAGFRLFATYCSSNESRRLLYTGHSLYASVRRVQTASACLGARTRLLKVNVRAF